MTVYTVRGKEYTLVRRTSVASSGSKFFGKYVFILRDSEGNLWRYLGKQVTANCKLYPTSSPYR